MQWAMKQWKWQWYWLMKIIMSDNDSQYQQVCVISNESIIMCNY